MVWILTSFFVVTVQAQELKIEVRALDPLVNLEELTESNYQKFKGIPQSDLSSNQLPDLKQREELFDLAGLTPYLQSFDDLDRDLLYMHAKQYKEKEFLKAFPNLPIKSLKVFYKLSRKKN